MSEEIKENLQQNTDSDTQTNDSISFDALSGDAAKVAELETQLNELTDKYYRANAEFENIKKRFEKEKADIANYANERFARDLLPAIDALEVGASFDPSDDEFAQKIKEGMLIAIDQFKKCFEKHGMSEISTDCEFDPNVHNAMMRVDSDTHNSGAIVQVMQKGYMINGRVLRPAMVTIAN
ncbi:nucleotide exchange factor GrpE [Campylobacter sp. faydin G-140]|uniref:nucleotide exchange factor GrpE n=1 Tax=Campylobacter anatolicus TaxID=2829105 RepID=UPI001B9F51A2|nr:nucleotide exchange factor GrpE [Campylobacter anatolicus]MBR8462025.1 nucleotide exchange factor GrpE [Campylobacter anatolicus]MBR8464888.1 nucleotide exchange factor GrpE [Campylobacter anatolicus]